MVVSTGDSSDVPAAGERQPAACRGAALDAAPPGRWAARTPRCSNVQVSTCRSVSTKCSSKLSQFPFLAPLQFPL